jgi:hypothetical protein
VTDDPEWSSLGGELSRIREFVTQAIGSWRSLDRSQGGDGTHPSEPTPNADTLSRRALMQQAISQNQFPAEWPFAASDEGVKECKERMAGDVEDEDAFCFGWAQELGIVDNADEEPSANSQQTTGAESPAETSQQSTMDREQLITEITENSNIEAESLEGMGDSCLETTYQHVVGNDDGGSNGDNSGDDGAGADDDDDDDGDGDGTDSVTDGVDADGDQVVVADREELESLIEEQVEQRVAANRERQQKRERVETIVANSAEYDQDDVEELLETPDSVLDPIERGLDSGVQMPATTGPDVSAHESTDTDPSEFNAGVIDND